MKNILIIGCGHMGSALLDLWSKEKEYIFYEFDEDYKVIKLSVLGVYFTDDSNKLMKNSEALLKRVFPEKSNEHIKTISIFDENELLSKISELSKR